MKEQLEQRLQKLKAEFESGQKMLADVEARQAELHKTLLRISGAIQVVEELLAPEVESEDVGEGPVAINPAVGNTDAAEEVEIAN